MRKLTLDEKISFKGLLALKGINEIPKLDMESLLFYWNICYGRVIINWYNLHTRKNKYKHCTVK